jgi:cytochrome P450
MATLAHELDLPEINLMDAEDRAARVALLDATRGESWLARAPMGYVVTRYEDVVAILRDRRFHQAASRLSELAGITNQEFLSRRRVSILTAEGDEHGRLRRLVAPAFTPKAADRLRPFMRDVVNELLDPLCAAGRAELVADVCEPYPIPVICELLGAPKEDRDLFRQWAPDILRIFNFNFEEDLSIIMRAQDELGAYVRNLIEERRDEPRDDLLTALIQAEEQGDRLSTQELETMVEAVLVGGTDTTRNQLGCTIALFAEHPDQWRLLAEQPELAGRAVEESMRYLGAIRGTARFANEDIEYRDVVFPAGTLVSLSFVGSNTDPSVFKEPHTFDIRREAASPQLTFGSGIHYCLGAWLARAELQEALTIMARRMPDLAVDGQVTWKPNTVGIWGAARLPLTFEAGH